MLKILFRSRRFLAMLGGLIAALIVAVAGRVLANWMDAAAIQQLADMVAGVIVFILAVWATGTAIEDAGLKAAGRASDPVLPAELPEDWPLRPTERTDAPPAAGQESGHRSPWDRAHG